MDLRNEKSTVLTLDAGGTNFVFSAIQGNREIIEEVSLPANSHDLNLCIESLIKGFEKVVKTIDCSFDAISFAFPGPADYELGIIGNLPNFKAFNGGVPLGPILEDHFKVPVFINNDGNLYAYGEALSGALPEINLKLSQAGSPKHYRNLIGLTLGTGFGAGIVFDNVLIKGDNSCGAEVHNTLNTANPDWNAEESVSTRAIIREYMHNGGKQTNDKMMPRDIALIAQGAESPDKIAAIASFESYGRGLGAAIANVATLVDGLVVIGGGITKAWDLFAPAMFSEINRKYRSGDAVNDRLSFKVFDLENEAEFNKFSAGRKKTIKVQGSGREIVYDDMPRIGVMKSKIGASKATWLGSYAYAIEMLNR